jgi:hypothetical protein
MCHLNSEETALLTSIAESLTEEFKNSSQLVFRSSKADPQFFKIDGLIRIAKTGDHVGDPIYINRDLLYTTVAQGEVKALDIPLAVSTLIHELGHHHLVKDHAKLDLLGTKIQTLLLTDSERSLFWNGNAAVITFNFNHVHSDDDKKRIQTKDELILEADGELHVLTDSIEKVLKCPGKRTKTDQVTGIRLYNVHGNRGIHFDKKTSVLTKPFSAWYILSCEGGKESDHGDLNFDLSFRKRNDETFEFLQDKLIIQQVSCSSHPDSC